MRTLAAQALTSVFLLVFGLLAHQVGRRLPAGQTVFRFGWELTAGVFVVQGLNSLFHDAFSTLAWTMGEGSGAWNAVLVWHPILDHSRTFLLTAYCVVLCVALLRASRGRPLPSVRRALAFAIAGMVVGGMVGWREDAFSAITHFTAVAIWDMMELLAMMVVLLVGLNTGGMDRSLWSALGINAFVLSLSVLLFAFLSRIDIGGWTPRPYHIHIVKAVLYVMMISVVYRQIHRLRKGRPVRGFFEAPPRPAVPSLHG
jgi:hypothetical protein